MTPDEEEKEADRLIQEIINDTPEENRPNQFDAIVISGHGIFSVTIPNVGSRTITQED